MIHRRRFLGSHEQHRCRLGQSRGTCIHPGWRQRYRSTGGGKDRHQGAHSPHRGSTCWPGCQIPWCRSTCCYLCSHLDVCWWCHSSTWTHGCRSRSARSTCGWCEARSWGLGEELCCHCSTSDWCCQTPDHRTWHLSKQIIQFCRFQRTGL